MMKDTTMPQSTTKKLACNFNLFYSFEKIVCLCNRLRDSLMLVSIRKLHHLV